MKIRFDPPERQDPSRDHGLRVEYGATKRTGWRWRWYLILLLVSSPLLYLLWTLLKDWIFVEAHGYITVPQTVVRAGGEGYIQELRAQPLTSVVVGTVLAKLENEPLSDRHERIQDELRYLETEGKAWQAQSNLSGIRQLLAFAEEQKQFYRKRLIQYERLLRQGAATQAELATARSQYQSSLERLAALEDSLRRENRLPPEAKDATARVRQLSLDLKEIDDQLGQLSIVSPASGIVTELFAQPGEYLAKGHPLLQIAETEHAFITAYVPPKYLDYAVIGQTATVSLPSGERIETRVVSVPGITQKLPGDAVTPLETRSPAIVAHLALVERAPVRLVRLVHGTPVRVRFHPHLTSSRIEESQHVPPVRP